MLAQWEAEQYEMAKLVSEVDGKEYSEIRWIGGVDISFDPRDPDRICAYLTVMDLQHSSNPPVYENYLVDRVTVPYQSGFLGFREVPFYIHLLMELKRNHPEYYPDVVLVDGFGKLHHRGIGSASHLGVKMDIPTIGVAKTLLSIDGLQEHQIKSDFKTHCHGARSHLILKGQSGQTYGVAFKSTDSVQNPIYISVGHKISLGMAIKVVATLCNYRVPEPIRNSDIKSKLHF